MSEQATLLGANATSDKAVDRLHIEAQHDGATGTVSYIVLDLATSNCALIDTVLNYSAAAGRISHVAADRLAARVAQLNARVEWILETHVHADHMSAAPYLKAKLGGKIAIGADVRVVQRTLGRLFLGNEHAAEGKEFCHLFQDGEHFTIGSLRATVMHTPGHTPACVSYIVSEGEGRPGVARLAAFVGDTLFMPDYGTARCDFPGGDAHVLYHSISRILSLPEDTVIYTGHDYAPGGREPAFTATVSEQRRNNIHVRDAVSEDEFVAMRTARDAALPIPNLMLPSVQVNLRAGNLPAADTDGRRYLKIPLDVL